MYNPTQSQVPAWGPFRTQETCTLPSPPESPVAQSPHVGYFRRDSGISLPVGSISLPVSTTEEPLVAVIGVGYVGIHLVSAFAAQYDVVAFDVSAVRLKTVAGELAHLNSIAYTCDARELARATHFLIAVPTLLKSDKSIDTTYVQEAINTLEMYARPRATVVMESSVAVGMTRKLLEPLMRSKGLMAGMSPERVDPGRTNPSFEQIPKIISGLDDITPGSLSSIRALYSAVFETVLPVSSPEVAEMTKLYENCQRMVAIAYANEMADACSTLGINPFEVSSAAASKPFGYLPISPSLGVGGHCIPVNPYYLLSNCEFPLLRVAATKMRARPGDVGDRALTELVKSNPKKFEKRRPRVLVVGAGFKRGQSLTTMSPGVELMRCLLDRHEVYVEYADPLVREESLPWVPKLGLDEWNREVLSTFDLIFVAVKQDGLDMSVLENLDGVQIEFWA